MEVERHSSLVNLKCYYGVRTYCQPLLTETCLMDTLGENMNNVEQIIESVSFISKMKRTIIGFL